MPASVKYYVDTYSAEIGMDVAALTTAAGKKGSSKRRAQEGSGSGSGSGSGGGGGGGAGGSVAASFQPTPPPLPAVLIRRFEQNSNSSGSSTSGSGGVKRQGAPRAAAAGRRARLPQRREETTPAAPMGSGRFTTCSTGSRSITTGGGAVESWSSWKLSCLPTARAGRASPLWGEQPVPLIGSAMPSCRPPLIHVTATFRAFPLPLSPTAASFHLWPEGSGSSRLRTLWRWRWARRKIAEGRARLRQTQRPRRPVRRCPQCRRCRQHQRARVRHRFPKAGPAPRVDLQ